MRVLALHSDLIVFISRVWQTTCTAVRAGDEGFLIDSPVYPDELEAIPHVLEQASFPVSALLCTHGDWDHLLGRLAFPDRPLGCGESTSHRLAAEPGSAQRRLREFDEQHYVQRPRPLSLPTSQTLPVPGHLSIAGKHELELHGAPGHTADGTAYLLPWLDTVVCGDYLSPVEIPMISEGGSLAAYQETLERLREIVAHAETMIPGHGSPLPAQTALELLEEDLAYLAALDRQGIEAPIPAGRRTAAQRRIHAENASRVRRNPDAPPTPS